MTKEIFLKTYVDIETNIFIREEKGKKLDELIKSSKKPDSNFSYEEIMEITNQLLEKNITIRYPLFLHLIYPVLSTEVEKENITAIKLLIRLFGYYGDFQKLSENTKFTQWGLLNLGLQIAPNDKEFLKIYESKQEDYFEYTLHELPIGILYGSDGASMEECNSLLEELNQYKVVCEKLNLDRDELIKECTFYFTTYKHYLSDFKSYNGFEDYLKKHGKYPH